MNSIKNDNKKSMIAGIVTCKCPRCRQGNMFVNSNPYSKGFMKMNDNCPVCGQPLDLEVGFYYGSSYVSYALTVALSVASLAIWWLTIGISIHDNRIFYWMTLNAVLLISMQPILMRIARSGWLNFFVHYDKDWKNVEVKAPERMIKKFQNAW
ncbi:MAG: DUF983 domain-containing protein [Agriterribacter sp.]